MLIDFYILGVWIMLGICLIEEPEDNSFLSIILASSLSWVGIGMVTGKFLKKFDKN